MKDFDKYFVESGVIDMEHSFSSMVYQIKENEPSLSFAREYLEAAKSFYKLVDDLRANVVAKAG